MKKMYNEVTKSDMPLNASTPIRRLENLPPHMQNANRINVISKKTPPPAPRQETKDELRAKLNGGSIAAVNDLEKINEQNIKNYKFRERRNRVIIIILIILLLLSLSWIAVYTSILMTKSNCFLYASGDSNVTFLVDGEEKTKFRTPANIQGDRLYVFDLSMRLDNAGEYTVEFIVYMYINGKKLTTRTAYEPNLELFSRSSDGWYRSTSTIQGLEIFNLCQGVILDEEYLETLNTNSFKLEVYANIKKV